MLLVASAFVLATASPTTPQVNINKYNKQTPFSLLMQNETKEYFFEYYMTVVCNKEYKKSPGKNQCQLR